MIMFHNCTNVNLIFYLLHCIWTFIYSDSVNDFLMEILRMIRPKSCSVMLAVHFHHLCNFVFFQLKLSSTQLLKNHWYVLRQEQPKVYFTFQDTFWIISQLFPCPPAQHVFFNGSWINECFGGDILLSFLFWRQDIFIFCSVYETKIYSLILYISQRFDCWFDLIDLLTAL